MEILTLIQLGLAGLEALLGQLKLKSDIPLDVVQDVEAAIAALRKVQGSPVTAGQLEDLRLTPQW